MTLIFELTRFKVKEGKSDRVDEWMKILNENMPSVLLTLEDEKMYVEAIFREVNKSGEYLYWFSLQGTSGKHINESSHEIDKIHIEFTKECIDRTSKTDMKLEVSMLPEWINRTIEEHERRK
jgi:hypothetical protein